MSKGNLPLAEGDLEWADSVTVRPKAKLCYFSRGGETHNYELCILLNLKKSFINIGQAVSLKLWIAICNKKTACISFHTFS